MAAAAFVVEPKTNVKITKRKLFQQRKWKEIETSRQNVFFRSETMVIPGKNYDDEYKAEISEKGYFCFNVTNLPYSQDFYAMLVHEDNVIKH